MAHSLASEHAPERLQTVQEAAACLRLPGESGRRWLREGRPKDGRLGGWRLDYRIPGSKDGRLNGWRLDHQLSGSEGPRLIGDWLAVGRPGQSDRG